MKANILVLRLLFIYFFENIESCHTTYDIRSTRPLPYYYVSRTLTRNPDLCRWCFW